MTILVGEKVKLVPVNDHNLRELFEMWNDREYAGEYGGFEPKNWDEFHEKFAKGATWFLIEKIANGEKIGWINYYWTRIDYPYLYEIGYALDPLERRRGYMTEAAKLVVAHIFATKNIERIEAVTDAPNLGSQGVLEKTGFKREGILRKRSLKNGVYRDEFIYGILREDLAKNRDEDWLFSCLKHRTEGMTFIFLKGLRCKGIPNPVIESEKFDPFDFKSRTMESVNIVV